MASCREFVELFLDEHLDGTLPPHRRRGCARHLSGCAACRAYLRSYRRVRRALRRPRADEQPLPEALVQAILRAAG